MQIMRPSAPSRNTAKIACLPEFAVAVLMETWNQHRLLQQRRGTCSPAVRRAKKLCPRRQACALPSPPHRRVCTASLSRALATSQRHGYRAHESCAQHQHQQSSSGLEGAAAAALPPRGPMCDRAIVRTIFPHGGPSSGGTRVWLSGSFFNTRSAASATFSFGPDLHLRSTNVTLITVHGLVEVVTPPVPASAGALPRTARVFLTGSCRGATISDRSPSSGPNAVATFTFWTTAPSRLPRCFGPSDRCDRPPLLFDRLSSLPPVYPSARYAAMLRSLPPGSRCTDWPALSALTESRCHMMAQRLPRARWEGRVEARAGGFEGCVLWLGSGAAHSMVLRVQYQSACPVDRCGPAKGQGKGKSRGGDVTAATATTMAAGAGCDLWPRGGRCLCLGLPPKPMLQDACARHLVSLYGPPRDLGAATEIKADPCEERARQRPCLVALQRSIPAPQQHEFETPTPALWHRPIAGPKAPPTDGRTSGSSRSSRSSSSSGGVRKHASESVALAPISAPIPARPAYIVDLVVAAHSTPCHGVLWALLRSLDPTATRARVWLYVKGALPPAELQRFQALGGRGVAREGGQGSGSSSGGNGSSNASGVGGGEGELRSHHHPELEVEVIVRLHLMTSDCL